MYHHQEDLPFVQQGVALGPLFLQIPLVARRSLPWAEPWVLAPVEFLVFLLLRFRLDLLRHFTLDLLFQFRFP